MPYYWAQDQFKAKILGKRDGLMDHVMAASGTPYQYLLNFLLESMGSQCEDDLPDCKKAKTYINKAGNLSIVALVEDKLIQLPDLPLKTDVRSVGEWTFIAR